MKLFIALTVGLLSTLAHAQTPRMQPGLWEIALTNSQGPSISSRQCVTQKMVEENNGLPPEHQKDNPCKRTSVKTEGNKVMWTVACTGQFTATRQGEMTAGANQYTGKQTMTMQVQGQTIKVDTSFTGKRVGDCK